MHHGNRPLIRKILAPRFRQGRQTDTAITMERTEFTAQATAQTLAGHLPTRPARRHNRWHRSGNIGGAERSGKLFPS